MAWFQGPPWSPTPRPAFLPPFQRCIDWNRDVLKKELGLTEEDIIDLPALFKLDKQGKAVPYFPNMVRGVPAPRLLSKNQLIQPGGVPRVVPEKQNVYQKMKIAPARCGEAQVHSTSIREVPFKRALSDSRILHFVAVFSCGGVNHVVLRRKLLKAVELHGVGCVLTTERGERMLGLAAWGRTAAKSGSDAPCPGEADGGGGPAAFLWLPRSQRRRAALVSPRRSP